MKDTETRCREKKTQVEDHVDPEVERIEKRTRRFALVEKVKPLVRRTVQRFNPRASSA